MFCLFVFVLQLQMKINDVEISWALGATLDLFEKMTSSDVTR